jgi:YgiT-type zinc finger domain-containing protein
LEENMKCSFRDCSGEYEDRRIVHTERHGDRIVVINDVPAQVCAVCGDVLFTADTVRRIEEIVREAGAPDRMAPVYEYVPSS